MIIPFNFSLKWSRDDAVLSKCGKLFEQNLPLHIIHLDLLVTVLFLFAVCVSFHSGCYLNLFIIYLEHAC